MNVEKMKIGIVIPLKSKAVSKNWNTTCENLKSTVNSVSNQTSNLFECVVIGHDCPDFMMGIDPPKGKVRFIKYDTFPPPVIGAVESENQLKYEFDRCHKILAGIAYLKSSFSDITHWFSLDADDLVQDKFVETLQSYHYADSIILDNGYIYFKNTGVINEEDEFSAYCGSSAIISDRLINLPEVIDESSHRSIPFGNISHVNMRQRLQQSGCKVVVAEERVIMYVRDNGENISNAAYANTLYKKMKKFIKMIVKYRHVDRATKQSFGLK